MAFRSQSSLEPQGNALAIGWPAESLLLLNKD